MYIFIYFPDYHVQRNLKKSTKEKKNEMLVMFAKIDNKKKYIYFLLANIYIYISKSHVFKDLKPC
jgi:hypothetical protein